MEDFSNNQDNKDINKLPQGNGPWWKPAMVIFSEISTWIAVPVILAVIAGKALDKHYNTGHFLLIILTVVAFAISAFGIVKAVRKFSAKIKKEEEKNSLK